MYTKHFNLMRRPFSKVPTATHCVMFPSFKSCFERACDGIVECAGPILVVGSSGCGKSTLLALLEEQFKRELSVITLNCAAIDSRHEMIQCLLFEMGLPFQSENVGELRLKLIDHLKSPEQCPNGLLLLVDEAHNLPLEVLEELRMITNMVCGSRHQIRLVIAGARPLDEKLSHPLLESFSQRIGGRCYLQKMSRTETMYFALAQMQLCGRDGREVFLPSSLERIFDITDGVPRVVTHLCDHSLKVASQQGLFRIDAKLVREAWMDLQQLPATPELEDFQASGPESGIIEFGSLDEPGEEAVNSGAAETFESVPFESSIEETFESKELLAPSSAMETDAPIRDDAPLEMLPLDDSPIGDLDNDEPSEPNVMPFPVSEFSEPQDEVEPEPELPVVSEIEPIEQESEPIASAPKWDQLGALDGSAPEETPATEETFESESAPEDLVTTGSDVIRGSEETLDTLMDRISSIDELDQTSNVAPLDHSTMQQETQPIQSNDPQEKPTHSVESFTISALDDDSDSLAETSGNVEPLANALDAAKELSDKEYQEKQRLRRMESQEAPPTPIQPYTTKPIPPKPSTEFDPTMTQAVPLRSEYENLPMDLPIEDEEEILSQAQRALANTPPETPAYDVTMTQPVPMRHEYENIEPENDVVEPTTPNHDSPQNIGTTVSVEELFGNSFREEQVVDIQSAALADQNRVSSEMTLPEVADLTPIPPRTPEQGSDPGSDEIAFENKSPQAPTQPTPPIEQPTAQQFKQPVARPISPPPIQESVDSTMQWPPEGWVPPQEPPQQAEPVPNDSNGAEDDSDMLIIEEIPQATEPVAEKTEEKTPPSQGQVIRMNYQDLFQQLRSQDPNANS